MTANGRISVAPFRAYAAEIIPLAATHEDPGYGKTNPDWESYLAASDEGECWAIVAHEGGEMVAYSFFTLMENPNHRGRFEALNIAFYIKPGHRGQLAREIIETANSFFRKAGASEVDYLVADLRLGRLLRRHGYGKTHELWSLRNE